MVQNFGRLSIFIDVAIIPLHVASNTCRKHQMVSFSRLRKSLLLEEQEPPAMMTASHQADQLYESFCPFLAQRHQDTIIIIHALSIPSISHKTYRRNESVSLTLLTNNGRPGGRSGERRGAGGKGESGGGRELHFCVVVLL